MDNAAAIENALGPRLAAIAASMARLQELVGGPTAPDLDAKSYASDWSVAQVLSHLGAQGDVFGLFLTAGLTNTPAPGPEAFPTIWGVWNAKTPSEQAADALATSAALLERIESLSPDEQAAWGLSMFGMDLDLAGLAGLILAEHVFHTWDVHVVTDPNATLLADAVPLLLASLPPLAGRLGKPGQEQLSAQVLTASPPRVFTLTIDDTVSLRPSERTDQPSTIELPAEALLRLVYGRLDPEHTPRVRTTNVDLDLLRQVFPGV
jgi:uncharacterized protein (TIGR03083 family)